jgi:glycerophosphoryl diester phosphodiesterase
MMKKRKKLLPGAERPLLFGHRGASATAPENTFAAFRALLDAGIPGVELDIHRCASGELVVIHDFELKRVSGRDGRVEHSLREELAELDVGSWFGEEFAGERIPLLEEVFDLLGTRVYYDIEIKQEGRECGLLEESLLRMIRERELQDRVVVSSFNPYSLRELLRLDGSLSTALIYTNGPEFPFLLRGGAGRFICRPTALKPNKEHVSRGNLFLKRSLEGFPVIPWTVDDEESARRLLSLGVDGLISNVPERLFPLLSRR